MRRIVTRLWTASVLALSACQAMDATSATLPPLEQSSPQRSNAAVAPVTLPPVPHRAWYYLHSAAIEEQLLEIHALADELAAARDPAVLTLMCAAGVDLDRDTYRAAYEAPDVNPRWVRIVDLTRWMVARCHVDAVQSVGEVLPKLREGLARFEAWTAGLTAS
jgi:hypothetical protein